MNNFFLTSFIKCKMQYKKLIKKNNLKYQKIKILKIL